MDVVIDLDNDVVSVTPPSCQTRKGGSDRVLTFMGLGIDDQVWVPTVFTKNRDRLLTIEMSRHR